MSFPEVKMAKNEYLQNIFLGRNEEQNVAFKTDIKQFDINTCMYNYWPIIQMLWKKISKTCHGIFILSSYSLSGTKLQTCKSCVYTWIVRSMAARMLILWT